MRQKLISFSITYKKLVVFLLKTQKKKLKTCIKEKYFLFLQADKF